jgi:cysteine synthase
VGEDFWPDTFDRSIVDEWVTVSDRDAFLMTRRLRSRRASSPAALAASPPTRRSRRRGASTTPRPWSW